VKKKRGKENGSYMSLAFAFFAISCIVVIKGINTPFMSDGSTLPFSM